MSADSSVGEAASFPSNNNRDPNSAPYSLPNSRKVYVNGKIYADIRVPFREISLAPTKTISGEIEVNEPVRVYDTSGPWGDPAQQLDVTQGLPSLRSNWIYARGDIEEIEGRAVRPQDNGYLSEKHAVGANGKNGNPAGVMLGADDLDAQQMLAIAAKVGLSETAFVAKSDRATRRVR